MENQFKFTNSVLVLPLSGVLFMWVVYWFEWRFGFDFSPHGIYPRTFLGLQGIIFSPFIHADFEHLCNNSLPIFILLAALEYFYNKQRNIVLIIGILLSGLLTWIIGRSNYHIGASSLIYVLVSFMFFKGVITKHYRLLALSLSIISWYGGLIWYIFPNSDLHISWEGHLAGMITGLLLAFSLDMSDYKKTPIYDWEMPNYNPNDDPFMKQFDENGHFFNLQKEEETLPEPYYWGGYDNSKIIYHYKETPNETKD